MLKFVTYDDPNFSMISGILYMDSYFSFLLSFKIFKLNSLFALIKLCHDD